MTKLATSAADAIFPGAGTVASTATSALTPKFPDAAALPEAGGTAAVKNLTQSVDTRPQDTGRLVSGAGYSESDNQADVLGIAVPRKRVGAARRILGG